MAFAPDSLLDIAKVFAARAATAQVRKRHEANFAFCDLPTVEQLTPTHLRPPAPIDSSVNGYLEACRVSETMPPDSPTDCNTLHRALSLVGSQCVHEMAASRNAIAPLEGSLDRLATALDGDSPWQVPIAGEDPCQPELENFKRLGHGFLLRGTLRLCQNEEDAAREDFSHALALAKRMRTCDGFLLHLLVGIALEVVAQKVLRQLLKKAQTQEFALSFLEADTLGSRKSELIEIFRSEFTRNCIPQALLYVRPWKPIPDGAPAYFAIPNLAAQWALGDHPAPYDPIETVLELTTIAEVFVAWIEEGWSVAPAIEEMRANYALGWPDGVAASPIFRQSISISDLCKARKELLDIENPFGRLVCARTLHSACEVYRAALLGELRVSSSRVLAAATRLGRAPACLEELVGNGFLSEVPIDPFSEAPLDYDAKDGAVWSAGPAGLSYAEAKRCGMARHDSPYWLKL